ncbi:mRNA decay activator protein ZFP36L3-like isoform X1 [Phaenicophaeus curvirostris]|uniref:mRNA decay activator protein ZFP36L3-like isoform X1 n=1 Tax=Phaenicophaeus curvirostris TaxID=33595 RepID=UPI0037F0FC55
MEREGVLLLTRIVPRGSELGSPPAKPGSQRLWGEPLALGVSLLLLGALQVALGAALLGALGEPLGGQLGAPVGTGATLLVSGALLVALAQGPSVGRARAALALGIVAAVVSLLVLGLQALLLPHGCPTCGHLGPAAQEAVLGAQALLMTSSAGGAALALTGAVAAARGGASRGGDPIVIYQTALPGQGAGLGEAPPPGAVNQ